MVHNIGDVFLSCGVVCISIFHGNKHRVAPIYYYYYDDYWSAIGEFIFSIYNSTITKKKAVHSPLRTRRSRGGSVVWSCF